MRRPNSENGRPSDPPAQSDPALLGPRLASEIESAQEVFRACPPDPLTRIARLRELLPEAEARAAVELFVARERATGKLPEADRWWLSRRGLEQSSHQLVARWRARRIAGRLPGGSTLHDGTCGMGMDALALLEASRSAGFQVVASDRDPVAAALAARNLAAFGSPGRVLCAEASSGAVQAEFALLDPDRRSGARGDERRRADPRFGSPSLAALIENSRQRRGAVWKLAPGVAVHELEELRALALETPLEWVAVGRGREVAETCVLIGELAANAGRRSAVVLREGLEAEFSSNSPDPDPDPLEARDLDDLAWIAIPHPSLIAARLLGSAGVELGARPLGPGLGWFGAAGAPPPGKATSAPFWRLHRVLDTCSADRKRIRSLLARHGVGPVRALTRGHPVAAAELEKRHSSANGKKGTLLVARTTRGQRAYLVEEVEPPS